MIYSTIYLISKPFADRGGVPYPVRGMVDTNVDEIFFIIIVFKKKKKKC